MQHILNNTNLISKWLLFFLTLLFSHLFHINHCSSKKAEKRKNRHEICVNKFTITSSTTFASIYCYFTVILFPYMFYCLHLNTNLESYARGIKNYILFSLKKIMTAVLFVSFSYFLINLMMMILVGFSN